MNECSYNRQLSRGGAGASWKVGTGKEGRKEGEEAGSEWGRQAVIGQLEMQLIAPRQRYNFVGACKMQPHTIPVTRWPSITETVTHTESE